MSATLTCVRHAPALERRFSLRPGAPLKLQGGDLLIVYADEEQLTFLRIPLDHRQPVARAAIKPGDYCELGDLQLLHTATYIDPQRRVQLVDVQIHSPA